MHVRHREERTAKGDQFVEGGGNLGADAEIVAEIDDAVPGPEALLQRGVQPGELRRLTVNRTDRPDAAAGVDRHEPFVCGAAHCLR